MTDKAFISYVEIHSQTDRALFSAADCRRLFELAGKDFPEPSLPGGAFRAMHDYDIAETLAAARRNVNG